VVLEGSGHSIAGGPYRDEGGASRSTPNPRGGDDMRSGRSTSTGTEQTHQARARQWSRSALRPTCCGRIPGLRSLVYEPYPRFEAVWNDLAPRVGRARLDGANAI
jgi:hypothetical protein